MEISKLDKNFKIFNTEINGRIIKVPSKHVSVFGLNYDEEKGFYRMPLKDAEETSEGVSYLNFHTSGGRVAFKTNAKNIKIYVTYDVLGKMYHMPLTGQAGFILDEIIKGKQYLRHTYALDFDANNGYQASSKDLDDTKMHTYILYFPLYNKVSRLSIEIPKGSKIRAYNPYKDIKPIVYYGSSITQGGCASRGDNEYQAFIARWNKIDYLNLGYSGNAKGESNLGKVLGNIPMSIFVYDYDHNAPSVEHLKNTHERLYKDFRKYQKDTPIIFMTAVNYYENPNEYEPRRKVIEETYNNALASGDKNVYFFDGRNAYESSLREFASVDGAHPNDLGFYMIAKNLYKIIKKIKVK